ncbi:DNA replication/repair protein RecF [Rubrivirga sp. S365]|uniref:DNA replication and repair protein RecF n=1 Tax=Rubrivirga litoralis TaxID=3075598 RepID=A0ABU3BLK9_9BACT|nr:MULTISPECIES: DNA replication/repair protein RecF [unclassified Rubrivirga]MDT0630177.1 DNA replication/repair protein RecF [Rubrivirga sp. F394]MDT7855688.1 DNA replication/repair protein RecF [Rubrivirga sp. S365]
MHLTRLRLADFRAHAQTELHPAPGVNLIVGPNGAGKTNLLEAISYLCLGKSFLAARDAHVVRRGAAHFDVEADIEGDVRSGFHARVAVVPGEGKRAFINKAPLDRLVDLVGRTPVVILSPADHELTAGGPSERRRFLDATLSQAYPVYLDDLVRYRRALRQRNALLQQVRRGRALPPGTLDAWDEEIAVSGGRIVSRRSAFVQEFERYLADAYARLGEPGEPLTMTYVPSVAPDEGGAEESGGAEDALRRALNRTRARSRETGRTTVGPHLDEVDFRVGGHDLRAFGSHGQHRTFALAVRVGQALYLHEASDERPLLLLDDVFGPLDPDRTRLVLDLLASGDVGQSFITAASLDPFESLLSFETDAHALFHVEQGSVYSTLAPSP